eukprot:TRINITY_DN17763_c0_g1_i1.p1 TRINITY_DN17763_c0_g1~~TRINITY_DN17763_c0_g1_i1.p1  ORF type:complete len:462 (+),score=111.52 TRINITY_DN17763_c0_g1_i1:274-1659(+)
MQLKSELRIHKGLQHPSIVKFEGYFETQDAHFICLEMCYHSNMQELLSRRKRLREPEVQYYMMQMIEAVAYMHTRLVIHRDLKLANIFLQNGLIVKIGDFGLAAQLMNPSERKKSFCGTPNYLAPELFDKQGGHSFEVDVWSLGVIMYTLLVGQPPFASSHVRTIFEKIKSNVVVFPEDIPISDYAKDVILRILNPSPVHRLKLTEIKVHPFFTVNVIPATLPQEALLRTPMFCRKSTVMHQHKVILPTVPVSNYEYEEDGDAKMVGDSIVVTPVREETLPIHVSKFFDYSKKYGLGYVLSNGTMGVFFNDQTSLISNSTVAIRYIQPNGGYVEDSPANMRAKSRELNKKIQLFDHFKNQLEVNLRNVSIEDPDMVSVQRWAASMIDISFKLSNDCIQSSFPDGTKLVVDPLGNCVYSDEESRLFWFDIQNLTSDLEPLQQRVDHLKSLVEFYNKSPRSCT